MPNPSSRPTARPSPEGLLIVDKPIGRSSFDVVRAVRRELAVRAVGHTGTLDPAASGVLCLAVGWASKLIRFLPHETKVYEAVVALGQVTDTDDAVGRVIVERPVEVSGDALVRALEALTGAIDQRPPAYSALHIGGERAYAKARRGETVELAPRPVYVERLEVLWTALPRLGLLVTCGPGTYVRSLARDLGERLGCGGHLAALRRVANGPFAIDRAVPLEELLTRIRVGDVPLLSSSDMLAQLPCFELDSDGLARIRLGQRVVPPAPATASPGQAVRLVDAAGLLQAVALWAEGGAEPALQPVRVRPS